MLNFNLVGVPKNVMFIIINKTTIFVHNNKHYECTRLSFIAQIAEHFRTNG